MKAVKFGGTSMATAESIKQVIEILNADKSRSYVVVSAPGKTDSEGKVTDMLIECAKKSGGERVAAFGCVRKRFESIASGLSINIDKELDGVEKMLAEADFDYIVSRGEYLSAVTLAKATDYEFIDSAEIIKFDEARTFDSERTQDTAGVRLRAVTGGVVIPGFYGSDYSGKIITFSRGGSDVSGAIVAQAVGASVYENWTDVDGFMTADPRIVHKARPIEMLTYKELRELAYMGANVLHPESIFPVRKSGIPIHILNTFNPKARGTLIVATDKFLAGEYKRAPHTITGIAGRKDFFAVTMEKSMMNAQVGFAADVLQCFKECGVGVEHMPSGIDTMTVIFERQSREIVDRIFELIENQLAPDHIELEQDLALIAVVGHGMSNKIGTATRVCRALYNASANIRMLDQGSSEMNIILAVKDKDYANAIKALHEEFSET